MTLPQITMNPFLSVWFSLSPSDTRHDPYPLELIFCKSQRHPPSVIQLLELSNKREKWYSILLLLLLYLISSDYCSSCWNQSGIAAFNSPCRVDSTLVQQASVTQLLQLSLKWNSTLPPARSAPPAPVFDKFWLLQFLSKLIVNSSVWFALTSWFYSGTAGIGRTTPTVAPPAK
jgi:hypothetical protein